MEHKGADFLFRVIVEALRCYIQSKIIIIIKFKNKFLFEFEG